VLVQRIRADSSSDQAVRLVSVIRVIDHPCLMGPSSMEGSRANTNWLSCQIIVA
jgi:hypothetical protein